MAKQIRITMPDSTIWDVAASTIARHYADSRHNAGSPPWHEVFRAMMADDNALLDHATNMTWTDVADAAIEISDPKPGDASYSARWSGPGNKTIVNT